MGIGIEMGRDIKLLRYFGIYFEGKELSLMWELLTLKVIDYEPKQLWDFDVSIVGGLGVRSFSLFNFLGFNLRGLWWSSYSTIGNSD